MKKLLILAGLLSVTTFSSFGQGQMSWANTSGTLISVNGAVMPVRADAGTTYSFALFVAPLGTAAPSSALDSNWQLVSAYTLNSTAAAGAGRMLNGGTATITGFAAGASVNFIVRGFSNSDGSTTWNPLLLTGLGTSSLGTISLGGGTLPIPAAFGVSAGQIGGFNIVVPEPSSMALAGLGAASLLLFRRRK
jgi:hypothetical protein